MVAFNPEINENIDPNVGVTADTTVDITSTPIITSITNTTEHEIEKIAHSTEVGLGSMFDVSSVPFPHDNLEFNGSLNSIRGITMTKFLNYAFAITARDRLISADGFVSYIKTQFVKDVPREDIIVNGEKINFAPSGGQQNSTDFEELTADFVNLATNAGANVDNNLVALMVLVSCQNVFNYLSQLVHLYLQTLFPQGSDVNGAMVFPARVKRPRVEFNVNHNEQNAMMYYDAGLLIQKGDTIYNETQLSETVNIIKIVLKLDFLTNTYMIPTMFLNYTAPPLSSLSSDSGSTPGLDTSNSAANGDEGSNSSSSTATNYLPIMAGVGVSAAAMAGLGLAGILGGKTRRRRRRGVVGKSRQKTRRTTNKNKNKSKSKSKSKTKTKSKSKTKTKPRRTKNKNKNKNKNKTRRTYKTKT